LRQQPILAAAALAGVDRVYRMGGAQAIAALACSTESVPRVDVVAGPGNLYVTLAKREVFGAVGVDALTGPTEIMIVADGEAPAHYLAADLASQLEDGDARPVSYLQIEIVSRHDWLLRFG